MARPVGVKVYTVVQKKEKKDYIIKDLKEETPLDKVNKSREARRALSLYCLIKKGLDRRNLIAS